MVSATQFHTWGSSVILAISSMFSKNNCPIKCYNSFKLTCLLVLLFRCISIKMTGIKYQLPLMKTNLSALHESTSQHGTSPGNNHPILMTLMMRQTSKWYNMVYNLRANPSCLPKRLIHQTRNWNHQFPQTGTPNMISTYSRYAESDIIYLLM